MPQKTRQISDLILAAFFMTAKVKLSHVTKEGSRLVFFFNEDADAHYLTSLMLDFYNRETAVDALTFQEMVRNLKAMTYQVHDPIQVQS